MEIDKETKDKIDKLPLVLRMAAEYVFGIFNDIVNGKCDEGAVTSTMGTLNQNAKNRYCSEDLMTYDKAAQALGFSVTNRNGLKLLLDKHGIKQVKITNKDCGFPRADIMALKDKLSEEVRERNIKLRQKAQRKAIDNKRKEALWDKIRKNR